MLKSITQVNQNDKQISKTVKRFFTRFHISSALKAANAYKQKGFPVIEIFQYLFLLIFSNRSMYITWLQALQMLLQLFRSTLSETAELTEEKINKLVDNFLDTLPSLLKSLLCAA